MGQSGDSTFNALRMVQRFNAWVYYVARLLGCRLLLYGPFVGLLALVGLWSSRAVTPARVLNSYSDFNFIVLFVLRLQRRHWRNNFPLDHNHVQPSHQQPPLRRQVSQ